MSIRSLAHGRVNLIGEHTDYNEGLVLPTSIPQVTRVELKSREGHRVHVRSNQFADEFSYLLGEEKASGHWADYVQGVTSILAREGHRLGGFQLNIESEIPIGSGLSSSAALEVALLKALDKMFALGLRDEIQIARLGQSVENDFTGARVGIMDQMACGLGAQGEALFIDTRDLTVQRIPLPKELELVVISSGVAHRNNDGGYNRRRAECEEACALLGIRSLRDLSLEDLKRIEKLPDPVARRARHVVTENARVLDAVKALLARDMKTLGELFLESHISMRDDYEVSIPEIDLLVELLLAQEGVHGARLTGGGFGGSVIALTQPGFAARASENVRREYHQRTKIEARTLVPG